MAGRRSVLPARDGLGAATLGSLEASFLVFRLPPLARNVSKRLGKLPKLLFIDSGLVCWLLGIRTERQLATHPLRGPIFESWVVSEVPKRRMARGELLSNRRGLSFYREQGGLEVDLVVEEAGEVILVEAKSGATPTSDMLAPARRVADRLAEASPGGTLRPEVIAVHGGDQRQDRSDGSVILPWSAMGDAADSLPW